MRGMLVKTRTGLEARSAACGSVDRQNHMELQQPETWMAGTRTQDKP